MHYSRRLIVQTLAFSRSYLHHQVSPPETLVVELLGREMAGNFDRKLRLPRIHFRVLLRTSNKRHGTHGFTSLPMEGVLRIFSPWKIRRLRPGLNPRTWVPKASTLPLDHRSRLNTPYSIGLLWMGDQPEAETSTWQERDVHVPVGFRPTIPTIEGNKPYINKK